MKFFYRIVPAVAVLLISGCAATQTATKPQHVYAGQQQQEEVIIASSSFYEACEKLSPDQQLEYSFTISKPVDFNVHYYTSEGMHYPVQKENIHSMHGIFTAEAKAIYCCMWSNNQPVPVSLTYDFKVIEK